MCSFIARGKLRDVSNDMPNRCYACQSSGLLPEKRISQYLAWRLVSPVAIAKLFTFGTSNLPPSKEAGKPDCGPANPMDAHEQKAASFKRQPFIGPCLVPVCPP